MRIYVVLGFAHNRLLRGPLSPGRAIKFRTHSFPFRSSMPKGTNQEKDKEVKDKEVKGAHREKDTEKETGKPVNDLKKTIQGEVGVGWEAVFNGLRYGPLVQCDVKESWVSPEVSKDPRVARAIAQAPNQDMLGTDTVNGILHRAWQRAFWKSWMLIFLQAACLVAVVNASYSFRKSRECRHVEGEPGCRCARAFDDPTEQPQCRDILYSRQEPSVPWQAILYFSAALPVVQELADIRSTCRADGFQKGMLQHVTAPANWLDLMVIALRVAGTWAILGSSHSTEIKGLVAGFCAQQWLTFLYGLRLLSSVGKRLLPIIWAARKTVVFALVVAMCLMAGTNAYYVIGARQESDSEKWPPYAAFLAIYRLGILGDFDIFHLEGSDPVMVPDRDWTLNPEDPEPSVDFRVVHACFYFMSIGMTVVLMNLFIGVLGQNYDLYESESLSLFACERAKVIVEHDNLFDLVASPLKCFCPSFASLCQGKISAVSPVWLAPEANLDQKVLIIFTGVRPPADEVRSLRHLVKGQVTGLEARFEKLEKRFDKLHRLLEAKFKLGGDVSPPSSPIHRAAKSAPSLLPA